MTGKGTEPEAVSHTDGELRREMGSRSGNSLGGVVTPPRDGQGHSRRNSFPVGPGGLNELVQEEIPRGQARSPADL